jgi:hypothetical protein
VGVKEGVTPVFHVGPGGPWHPSQPPTDHYHITLAPKTNAFQTAVSSSHVTHAMSLANGKEGGAAAGERKFTKVDSTSRRTLNG